MKSYVDCMIENKAAKSRAKSAEKKQALREQIYAEYNYMPPKNLGIKHLEGLLNGGMTKI